MCSISENLQSWQFHSLSLALFHCLTMCTGKSASLGASWAQCSQKGARFHLPGCSWPFPGGAQRLGSTSRARVPRQPRWQQGWQSSASPGPAQGVLLRALSAAVGLGVAGLWHRRHCSGAWAAPGLQLCSGWATAFSGPPSSAVVRWIRDDLPLVNYITVNVSYITAAPPKIMAKILLTFWCCFMYFM